MGTIAARDCLRVLELTEQVAASLLVTARQGIALRRRLQPDLTMTPVLTDMYADLESRVPLVVEDRALDGELRALLAEIRAESWELYAP
jgi:histidine ammonia-lyase